jgi:Domain of unknown function (DUF477).
MLCIGHAESEISTELKHGKMPNARQILNNEEDRRVVEAIKQAELNTSGEIKVHIENRCKGDVEERSLFVFDKLKLHETKLRNGVLIYLAVRDHKLPSLATKASTRWWEMASGTT